MKIDYQERIDEYLLHRMSDEERMAFENEVNSDKELQEQLSFTEDVQQVLKSRNEKLAKMEEWQGDYEWEDDRVAAASVAECRPTGSGYDYCSEPTMESRRVATSSPIKKMFYWGSGIAAVVIAGFFLVQNLFVAKSPDVVQNPIVAKSSDKYFAPPRMNDATFRVGSDNSDIELLLSQKKYDEALNLIEEKSLALKNDFLELVHDATMDDERRVYYLRRVTDKQDELKWLKANALHRLHQNEDALLILDELRNTKGYYQMSADSLYKYIEKQLR